MVKINTIAKVIILINSMSIIMIIRYHKHRDHHHHHHNNHHIQPDPNDHCHDFTHYRKQTMYQRHRHHHHRQRHRPSWWIIDHHSSKSTTGPGTYLSPLWSYQGRRDVHDAPRLSRQKREKKRSRHHRSSKSFTDLVNPLKKAGVTTRMIPRNYLTSKRAVVSARSHNQQLLWCFCPNLTEVLDCVVQIIPALDRTLIGSTLTDQNADEYCNERVSPKKTKYFAHTSPACQNKPGPNSTSDVHRLECLKCCSPCAPAVWRLSSMLDQVALITILKIPEVFDSKCDCSFFINCLQEVLRLSLVDFCLDTL